MRRLRTCNRKRAKAQRFAAAPLSWKNKGPVRILADLNRIVAAFSAAASSLRLVANFRFTPPGQAK